RQAQPVCYRHLERAAELLRVFDRRLSRRRIAGVETLLIEGDLTVTALEEVAKPDAQIRAVGPGRAVREGRVVRATEPESAIVGAQGSREQALAPPGLHLKPGIGAHPQGHICGAEVAVGIAFLIVVGCQAEL